MSFECNCCGKGSVDKYGDWCSKCQEEEFHAELNSQSEWYSKSRLCQTCNNSEGPDWNDKCIVYNMPLYMVARKNKCKHYKEYIDNGVF